MLFLLFAEIENLNINNSFEDSLVLNWLPPQSCDEFEFEYYIESSTNFTQRTLEKQITIPDLEPCEKYSVKILPIVSDPEGIWKGDVFKKDTHTAPSDDSKYNNYAIKLITILII